jgi:hypothetical protein
MMRIMKKPSKKPLELTYLKVDKFGRVLGMLIAP